MVVATACMNFRESPWSETDIQQTVALYLWTDKDFEIVVVGHCLVKILISTWNFKAFLYVFTFGKTWEQGYTNMN